MNAIAELAKMFKERENNRDYSPMLGNIIEVTDIKISLGEKIILDSSDIKSIVELTDDNIGCEVVLLPYSNDQKFILIGVVQ